ncbi:glycosyltransferase family 25 protein [Pseudoalteromonas sp. MMG010]|uniref:glycosyltransferase family 25 protein n=1 Tax=Pseudoalteromonas sp. MMG010 TaxID=2822685 RepID=UPI001B3A03EB|nr:glycosyltransferase family 25 protein [Pseudoalteromonas sp. MMG010]MBQ4833407.1 glycosyltransferase family 25 protein [Pseudoalteromonas sp. MMG010]
MAAVFVINLARSKDRLQQTHDRLAAVSLPFERIDAVDGALLSEQEISQHYDINLNKKNYHYPLQPGQIGCYLSHRKAWQTIVDRQLEYAIVLEDDFYIDASIHHAINNIEKLSQPWQLIKLAAYQNRPRPIAYSQALNHQQRLVIHSKLMTGCCATAISYSGAKQLLEATTRFGRPVDCDLQHSWETGVFGYSLMPYPILQDEEIKSDIKARSSQKRAEKAFFKRKIQQLSAMLANSKATKEFIKKTQNSHI